MIFVYNERYKGTFNFGRVFCCLEVQFSLFLSNKTKKSEHNKRRFRFLLYFRRMKQMRLCLVLFSILFCSACQTKEQVRHQQFMVQGQVLYETHCANCHQKNGQGLAALYPSITKSVLLSQPAALVCLMRNGRKKGDTQLMPANNQLQPLDLALISTYILNKWGSENGITEPDSVQKILKKCN